MNNIQPLSSTPVGQADFLKQVEQRLLWLSHWMIHHANHIRTSEDGIKTGGHQASSASVVSMLTALYFSALKPEDRVAVKPRTAHCLSCHALSDRPPARG